MFAPVAPIEPIAIETMRLLHLSEHLTLDVPRFPELHHDYRDATTASFAKSVTGQEEIDHLQGMIQTRIRQLYPLVMETPEYILQPTQASFAKTQVGRAVAAAIEADEIENQRLNTPRVHETSEFLLQSTTASRSREAATKARRAALKKKQAAAPAIRWR
jgi:hypothetical protein